MDYLLEIDDMAGISVEGVRPSDELGMPFMWQGTVMCLRQHAV